MAQQKWKKLISTFAVGLLVSMQPSAAVLAADGNPPPAADQQQPTVDNGGSDSGSQPAAPDPAGPQAPTGPQDPTGPQSPTGAGQTGPTQPTGVIPEFAFNEQTQRWDATNQGSFSWSAALGRYASSLYRFDDRSGWWYVIPTPPAVVPSSSGVGGGGSAPTPATGAPLASTTGYDSPGAAILATLLGLNDPSNSNTGNGSTNNLMENSSSSAMLQILGNALINNSGTSTATSGDAQVAGNTEAGDAASGPASVIENLLNLLNAAWSWSNGGLSYFAQNLFGDQTGDIHLQPTSSSGGGGQLGSGSPTGTLASNTNTGQNSVNNATSNSDDNLTVVNRPNGAITNDVDLLAQSGDAAVTGNTRAGNATTGDATVNLNILNLINSAISSGDSFFGLLNIFGSLDGDILFPDGFLNAVADTSSTAGAGGNTAANTTTGQNSTNNARATSDNTATIVNDPSASFNNNLQTAAQSGTASVNGNTVSGDGQSGDASTRNNLFNLFNTNVMGDNAVLVLVNVMGRWMGHIMTLPDAGTSTGALLTGNATVQNQDTGQNSTNNANVTSNHDATITNSPTGSITNNIKAGAISGNASVEDNTVAGSAKSGAAKVATNVANIFSSSLNLKKWFGVLVINVFGSWNGSVGDDTTAGEVAVPTAPDTSRQGNGNGETVASSSGSAPVFGAANGAVIKSSATSPDVQASVTSSGSANAIVAATHTPIQNAQAAAKATGLLILLAAAMLLLAAGVLSLERKLRR
jgi:hypothetical protein